MNTVPKESTGAAMVRELEECREKLGLLTDRLESTLGRLMGHLENGNSASLNGIKLNQQATVLPQSQSLVARNGIAVADLKQVLDVLGTHIERLSEFV